MTVTTARAMTGTATVETGAVAIHAPLLRCDPGAAPDAVVRLLCLPHAGAGASSFTRWTALLAPSVELVRIQLPGREDLAAVAPFRRASDAVAALVPEVTALARSGAWALYGHSMGALLAVELARELSAAGLGPRHLFVSGRRAPQLPARRPAIHHLPDDAFLAALAPTSGPVAGGAALRRYVLRTVRADLELCEEDPPPPGPAVSCPITAFHGVDDPIVDREEADAWACRTEAAFTVHAFAGDHLFHQRHRAALAALMADALGRAPQRPPGEGTAHGAGDDGS